MKELAALIGKPWAAPCDPPNSFECWELVRHVRTLYGRDTPSVVDRKDRKPKHREHITTPSEDWAELARPVVPCVVRIGDKHVGVYIGRDQVIHAQLPSGVRIDKVSLIPDRVSFWERKADVC